MMFVTSGAAIHLECYVQCCHLWRKARAAAGGGKSRSLALDVFGFTCLLECGVR